MPLKDKEAYRIYKREYNRKRRLEDPIFCSNSKVAEAKYRTNNPEKVREISLKSKRKHSGRVNAENMARHLAKTQQTPRWLSDTQRKEIRSFYIEAQRLKALTGIQFHVDHIIPISGEAVRGLHVPWNLQVLPYYDNISKGNKSWPQ